VNDLSKAAKALILTWILIGLLIAGGAGFYLGRITAPKIPDQPSGIQTQDGLRDGQQLNGGQQPLQVDYNKNRKGQTEVAQSLVDNNRNDYRINSK